MSTNFMNFIVSELSTPCQLVPSHPLLVLSWCPTATTKLHTMIMTILAYCKVVVLW